MSLYTPAKASDLVGSELDRLTYEERLALAGKWIAHEIYSTKTRPLRRIEVVGDSAADCSRQLAARGLEPKKYEFILQEA